MTQDVRGALLAAVFFSEGDSEFACPRQDERDDVGEDRIFVDPEALVGQGAECLLDLAVHILLCVIHVDARIGVPLQHLLLPLCAQSL